MVSAGELIILFDEAFSAGRYRSSVSSAHCTQTTVVILLIIEPVQ